MNKIKNLFYDTNDIIVALLILCCAAFVIFTRIDAILTYPSKIFTNQSARSSVQTDLPNYDDSDLSEDDTVVALSDEDSNATQAESELEELPEPEMFSLYISYGESMNQVAKDIVALGFFDNAQDFFETLEKHNVASKVQIGNFIIPSDSTKDDVVKIITNRANGN